MKEFHRYNRNINTTKNRDITREIQKDHRNIKRLQGCKNHRVTQYDYKETQDDYKETQYDYKEKQEDHKETQYDYREAQYDNKETQ